MSDFPHSVFSTLQAGWDAVRRRLPSGAAARIAVIDRRRITVLVAAALFLLLIYYPVGMLVYDGIDDDINLAPAPAYSASGGSEAVSMAATLAARESDHWLANKPFWHPSAALDNTPNFQLGLIYAVSRFAFELGDHLGRVRGSSAADPNLDHAAELLRTDGTTWYWGQGNIIPMAKAESRYREGVQLLLAYNKDVAAGNAPFDRRADSLVSLLDQVAADLSSTSAALDVRAEAGGGYFDTKADDVFYNAKGKLYGYYMILRALGDDDISVLREKNADEIWNNMLGSLKTGATMDPLIVVNGRQDSMLMPSHLSNLGFHLLRARTQLRELSDTLQR